MPESSVPRHCTGSNGDLGGKDAEFIEVENSSGVFNTPGGFFVSELWTFPCKTAILSISRISNKFLKILKF